MSLRLYGTTYDLAKTVKDILKNNQQNELIVITDLFGGSVNNEFFNYGETSNAFNFRIKFSNDN